MCAAFSCDTNELTLAADQDACCEVAAPILGAVS